MESNIQKKIDHVIVLMMENRSFDNLLGWLYDDTEQPKHFLPVPDKSFDKINHYNGLSGLNYSNPLDLNNPDSAIKIKKGVTNFQIPNPDPHEEFKYMNRQLFGLEINTKTQGWLPKEEGIKPGMQGFLSDYITAKCSSEKIAPQIMQTYTSTDLSVMSAISKKYAVSDNYHASTPTQTWPNRAFMHAGTSNGKVNNFPYFPHNSNTIFNVFEDAGHSWKVYKSSKIIPSLTRIQMRKLWLPKFNDNFSTVDKFINDCSKGMLPAYSFIEPSFVVEKGNNATSEHPPADVCSGDHFLETICNAVVQSPVFDKILFIINFDEHGGCPDHVPPKWTAVAPDDESKPGKHGFNFNRYGVRVPAIFISPHIPESTCIRANGDPWNWDKLNKPFDHTSILAMLLDWKKIDRNNLLGERVQTQEKHAFDNLLSGDNRTDRPQFKSLCKINKQSIFQRIINFILNLLGLCGKGYSLTSLQKSILVADLHFRKAQALEFRVDVIIEQDEIDDLLKNIKTEEQMLAHFESLY
ncbi:MAG: alkaline phosphatase family protein [Thiohalomonadales bacterium]